MNSSQITIECVQSPEEIQITSKLATDIWNEYYVPIIGQEQVNYMVDKFQSPNAIETQIKNEGYEYYVINHLLEPMGYISVKLYGNELFLSKFYIDKQKRGTGLGKAGLNFIMSRAKELKANSITLTVNKYNLDSIKVYEKMGFKNEGSIITDIGGGYVMDDYKMRLQI